MASSRALVSVKMIRVDGKSKSSSGVREDDDEVVGSGSEGKVYSSEESIGDIFE